MTHYSRYSLNLLVFPINVFISRCTPGQYQCKNGHCLHPSDLCNGQDNCGDNSDEADCKDYTCLSTQYRCAGNDTVQPRCIPAKSRCDKTADCPLGEDELDCPPVTCPPTQFKCKNDKCIPAVWVCDTDNDCADNSDEEQNCQNRTCRADHFRCSSGEFRYLMLLVLKHFCLFSIRFKVAAYRNPGNATAIRTARTARTNRRAAASPSSTPARARTSSAPTTSAYRAGGTATTTTIAATTRTR